MHSPSWTNTGEIFPVSGLADRVLENPFILLACSGKARVNKGRLPKPHHPVPLTRSSEEAAFPPEPNNSPPALSSRQRIEKEEIHFQTTSWNYCSTLFPPLLYYVEMEERQEPIRDREQRAGNGNGGKPPPGHVHR
jgi:hypothetical protein